MATRAFLAIPLSARLKRAILSIQSRLAAQIKGARWAHPDNLHLTLHFFAALDQESLEKIKVSVLSVSRHQQPFLIEVRGLGVFPNLHRPRTIWLGLNPEDPLRTLHGAIQASLRDAGVNIESAAYTPHVTIGRLRQAGPELAKGPPLIDRTLLAGPLQVDRLVLFESHLLADGAKHRPLFTANFGDSR